MSLFSAPHPMVPLATLTVDDGHVSTMPASALEAPRSICPGELLPPGLEQPGYEGELALVGEQRWPAEPPAATYSLFGPNIDNIDVRPPPGLCPDAEENGGSSPDFLGRLDHLKSLFRVSATQEPVSIMIHRVGPMLILDDGPRGWVRSTSTMEPPLPPLSDNDTGGAPHHGRDLASQLMLAELDPLFNNCPHSQVTGESSLPSSSLPSRLPPSSLPVPESSQICVKNTFIDVVEDGNAEDDDDGELWRTRSAPGRINVPPGSPMGSGDPDAAWRMPVAPLVQQVQQEHQQWKQQHDHDHPQQQYPARPPEAHERTDVGTWSLIPYQPDPSSDPGVPPGLEAAAASSQSSVLNRLLQLATPRKFVSQQVTRMSDAIKSLYAGIPPQPSRFGRAVEWSCGPYKVLLGCDLVVYRSSEAAATGSDYASFKMLPPGGSGLPSRDERLDSYLENLMCDIKKAVWGLHGHGGETSWSVFNTQDLPAATPRSVTGRLPAPQESSETFDEKLLLDQGQRLLHFLRQQCDQEGGTYWLYREQNSSAVELFDLSGAVDPTDDSENWKTSRAFATSQSLALPIASLCLHLAKAMPDSDNQRRLLQKALRLLEPVQEEHPGAYSMAALHLACCLMRTPVAAIPDKPGRAAGRSAGRASAAATAGVAQQPAAVRLSMALQYLEDIIRLLGARGGCCDGDGGTPEEVTFHAGLLLQANVAYAECILKLVREALIPTYSSWLSEVQRMCGAGAAGGGVSAAVLARTKQLSAALLLWRLFWLCRARRALAFLSQEKRETECWILERDLCETMGDALYGLSRYPADDAGELLSGKMGTADGICQLAEEGLRVWGLHGPGQPSEPQPSQTQKQKQKGSKRISSPVASSTTDPVPANSPRRAGASTSAAAAAFVDGGSRSRSGSGSPASEPHNMSAMFLARLNPLKRGMGDEKLRDDPLVQDSQRMGLWTRGQAFKQCLALFEQAASRLRRRGRQRSPSSEEVAGDGAGGLHGGGVGGIAGGVGMGSGLGVGGAGGAEGGRRRASQNGAEQLHRSEEATMKIARKLAHLYNEEARSVLMQPGGGQDTEAAEELLNQAHHWMLISGDHSNASRVLLNLSELHARRAEAFASKESGDGAVPAPFSEEQYNLWAKAVECCEEAAKLSDGTLGRKEGAFAHLRIGVHLSVRVPVQLQLAECKRRAETLTEIADRHFSKALRGFDELKDEREVAVCHFHMADLALQEQQMPGVQPLSKARLTSALRHARRSAEYWERMGVLQYAKDFLAAHVRTARLLDKQPKSGAFLEALEHLAEVESQMLAKVKESDSRSRGGQKHIDKNLLTFDASGKTAVAVTSLRREMGKFCQAALRQGEDTERAKTLYRRVLRNDVLFPAPSAGA